MDDLIADFLTETNESIADLDVALVKLEQTPDDKETLSLIFRLVHTIKGPVAFLACHGSSVSRTPERTCWARYATARSPRRPIPSH